MSHRPFHLAFPVKDLEEARRFYGEFLGCDEGRSSERWIDFDFFGNQITCHLVSQESNPNKSEPVDGVRVPIPHFGAILSTEEFQALVERLQAAGIEFLIPPQTRFAGKIGEQQTLFLKDPSGNALEFKSFPRAEETFAQS